MKICEIEVCGGLGNQLFQIATAYSYSKKTNKVLYINTQGWTAHQGNHPNNYKTTIFSNFRYKTEHNCYVGEVLDLREIQEMKFNELYDKKSVIVRLMGYFQSPKYFQDHLKEFESELVLPKVKTDHIKSESIAFHIRAGDYKHFRHIFGDIFPYFHRMFEKFNGEDIHVYTDSPQEILKEFSKYDFKLIRTSSELNDLTMLSHYDRIVCSNSSFSWWGAVLGNPKKEIIVPDKWLLGKDCSDIYMNNMIKYEF